MKARHSKKGNFLSIKDNEKLIFASTFTEAKKKAVKWNKTHTGNQHIFITTGRIHNEFVTRKNMTSNAYVFRMQN